jgi:hypothetical protein
MKYHRLLKGFFALAAVGLASAVLGRYGDLFGPFLRADVLLGFAVVATLVALNTLESRQAARQEIGNRALAARFRRLHAEAPTAEVVTLWQPAESDRKAA